MLRMLILLSECVIASLPSMFLGDYSSAQGGDSALMIERGVVDVAKRKMTLVCTNVTWGQTVQYTEVRSIQSCMTNFVQCLPVLMATERAQLSTCGSIENRIEMFVCARFARTQRFPVRVVVRCPSCVCIASTITESLPSGNRQLDLTLFYMPVKAAASFRKRSLQNSLIQ